MQCSQVNDVPLNDDPRVAVRVDGREVYAGRAPRVVLETATGLSLTETLLLHYAAGASCVLPAKAQTAEVFVVTGAVTIDGVPYVERDYVRWTSNSKTALTTAQGCVLYLKLSAASHTHARIHIRTNASDWQPGLVPGLSVMSLHEQDGRATALVRWKPGTVFQAHRHWGGEEILVLDGVFRDEHGQYPAGTWLRSPHLSQHRPYTEHEGATILVKVGHLA